jgi:hypothetical protein
MTYHFVLSFHPKILSENVTTRLLRLVRISHLLEQRHFDVAAHVQYNSHSFYLMFKQGLQILKKDFEFT